MGVTIRKKGVVNFNGRRKSKRIGASKAAAFEVKRVLEAKLALGDLGFLTERDQERQTFGEYAARWQKEHANVHCKPSSAAKHDQVLRLYLLPKFSAKKLGDISRQDLKELLADLVSGKKPNRSSNRDSETVRSYRRAIAAGQFGEAAARADVADKKLTAGELQALLREARKLSRNSIRLILATARVIFNHAIEDG